MFTLLKHVDVYSRGRLFSVVCLIRQSEIRWFPNILHSKIHDLRTKTKFKRRNEPGNCYLKSQEENKRTKRFSFDLFSLRFVFP